MTLRALYDLPAPAKLNLFLHVIGRRDDGHHLLQSLFVLIDWSDTLHVERRDDGAIARHDLGAALPADDLCLRAARTLQAESGTRLGADLSIDKRLPSGAGMGGGSSDAATVLLALNRLWGLDWPRSRLAPIALRLGADVPFFLGGRNAFVEGIGERLTPVPVPPRRFAVVKPAASIETRAVFTHPALKRDTGAVILSGFPAGDHAPGPWIDAVNQAGWGTNDLQPVAEMLSPEVRQAAALLQQRFGNSRMTGSGSAVFAVLDGEYGADVPPGSAIPAVLPQDWVGRMCRSLSEHPLRGWAED
jgi:4-diphosphocytidyl-2-C-methyl-D-erythritol kinase